MWDVDPADVDEKLLWLRIECKHNRLNVVQQLLHDIEPLSGRSSSAQSPIQLAFPVLDEHQGKSSLSELAVLQRYKVPRLIRHRACVAPTGTDRAQRSVRFLVKPALTQTRAPYET